MTKAKLSEKTGISPSTITKMGKGKSINMGIIYELCDFFNCTVEEIVIPVKTERVEEV